MTWSALDLEAEVMAEFDRAAEPERERLELALESYARRVLEHRRERDRELIALRRLAGRCIACGGEPKGGHSLCPACLARRAARAALEHVRVRAREWRREVEARLRAEFRCVDCRVVLVRADYREACVVEQLPLFSFLTSTPVVEFVIATRCRPCLNKNAREVRVHRAREAVLSGQVPLL